MQGNRNSQTRQDLLGVARHYRNCGLSVLAVKAGTKNEPVSKWKRYQDEPATDATLQRWFSSRGHNIAIILGSVSGDLACRDFDCTSSYNSWASENPTLARELPTVRTARGCHVYGRVPGINTICIGDGELRGNGSYCLAPPSRHPAGLEYAWVVPLDGNLRRLSDTEVDGLTLDRRSCNRENRANREYPEDRRQPKKTEAVGGGELGADIQRAIDESLPAEIGRRNFAVFNLARRLKALPELAGADMGVLIPIVRQWHELGVRLGLIGTYPFEETEIDFRKAWPQVKWPSGVDPFPVAFGRATSQPYPIAAQQFGIPELQLLVALCRELQVIAGNRPFFLSCRKAGKSIGVDPSTASRWLFLMKERGVVAEIQKGSQATGKATRFQYLGD